MDIRSNRPGPKRRCDPCPACGDDAMRQYGAKHHGVVHRYFYACQTCQHTDVWREVDDGVRRWEKIPVPMVEPRPEACRLEITKKEDAAMRNANRSRNNPASAPCVVKNTKLVQKEEHADSACRVLYAAWQKGGVEEVEKTVKEMCGPGDMQPIIETLAVAFRNMPPMQV